MIRESSIAFPLCPVPIQPIGKTLAQIEDDTNFRLFFSAIQNFSFLIISQNQKKETQKAKTQKDDQQKEENHYSYYEVHSR